jgi:hypothetical protein
MTSVQPGRTSKTWRLQRDDVELRSCTLYIAVSTVAKRDGDLSRDSTI